MRTLKHLFDVNERWALERTEGDPEHFARHVDGQQPDYMWIGCCDSRVMPNELLGLKVGELFVHRNIANLVIHTDFNCLSALEFGINQLGIRKILICGHYGCAGVGAALQPAQPGIADGWLRHVRDVRAMHESDLKAIENPNDRHDRLVELNVLHQVLSLCHTTVAQDAWSRGVALEVHGWVYNLANGRLQDLDCCITSAEQVQDLYHMCGREY